MANVELCLQGHTVRVPDTPEELLRSSGATFADPQAGVAALESLRALWGHGKGLIIPGGACFLEDLGDTVMDLSVTTDVTPAEFCPPILAYAFTATPATRIVTAVRDVELGALLEAEGFVVFNTSEDVAGRQYFHMGLDLDTWLPRFGPRLFYAEACRLGQVEKADRVLHRWARMYRDESVLVTDDNSQPSEEEKKVLSDWFADEIERRWAIAEPLFGDRPVPMFSVDHLPTCRDPQNRPDCACGLIVSFIDQARIVRVDGSGELSESCAH